MHTGAFTNMVLSVDDFYQHLALKWPKSSLNDKHIRKITTYMNKFISSNEKTFDFGSCAATELINLLIQYLHYSYTEKESTNTLSSEYVQFIFNTLQVLRILSRDSKVVQSIDREVYQCLINFTAFSEKFSSLDSGTESFTALCEIDGETLKVLCNLSYHGSAVRKYLRENEFSKTLLSIVQKRTQTKQFLDSDVYVTRLLFLLSALEVKERLIIRRDYHGVAILCESLSTVLGIVNSDNCAAAEMETNDKVVLSTFATKLSCEILKALFNVTVGISDSKVLDTSLVNECTHLMELVFFALTNCNLDLTGSDTVFTHSANLILNMPKDAFEALIPNLKENMTGGNRTAEQKVTEFQGRNFTAVTILLEGLKERLHTETNTTNPELLQSLLSCLSYMCRLSKPVRKYVRFQVLPPIKDASKRPEESSDLRGKLVKLMTDIDRNVKYLAADFLFVLCKEDVDRLVKHTGYGNAAGFLASRGLMLGRNNEFTGDYSSSDDESDTEEYRDIEDKIDPITGAIREEHDENPLLGMTEEEKELEAEKLVNLIGQLSDMKIIQPMKVGEDGRPVELGENEIKDIMRKKLDDSKQ